jgi:hypothetical protein
MKRFFIPTLMTIILLSACNQKKQYTETSPEIDTYKRVVADYESRDWNDFVTHYADSAKILIHATDKDAINVTQFASSNKEDANGFKDWKYTNKKFLMLTKDNGETWVYFNGLWQGTFIPNNKLYEIPAQINVRFENGKIIREEGYWDISNLMSDIQKMQDTTKAM